MKKITLFCLFIIILFQTSCEQVDTLKKLEKFTPQTKVLVVKIPANSNVQEAAGVLHARFSEYNSAWFQKVLMKIHGNTVEYTFLNGAPPTDLLDYLSSHAGKLTLSSEAGEVLLTNKDVVRASASFFDGRPGIAIELSEPAGERLYAFTTAHVGETMSLHLDSDLLMHAKIAAGFGKHFYVSDIDPKTASRISVLLRHGQLATTVQIQEYAVKKKN